MEVAVVVSGFDLTLAFDDFPCSFMQVGRHKDSVIVNIKQFAPVIENAGLPDNTGGFNCYCRKCG